jgi:hypothetical protein
MKIQKSIILFISLCGLFLNSNANENSKNVNDSFISMKIENNNNTDCIDKEYIKDNMKICLIYFKKDLTIMEIFKIESVLPSKNIKIETKCIEKMEPTIFESILNIFNNKPEKKCYENKETLSYKLNEEMFADENTLAISLDSEEFSGSNPSYIYRINKIK